MSFDDSVGYLIGAENTGLKQYVAFFLSFFFVLLAVAAAADSMRHRMFTFMNTARIGTALQGIGAAELAYQGAMPYAKVHFKGAGKEKQYFKQK